MNYILMVISAMMICSYIGIATAGNNSEQFAISFVMFPVAAAMSVALNFILVIK